MKCLFKKRRKYEWTFNICNYILGWLCYRWDCKLDRDNDSRRKAKADQWLEEAKLQPVYRLNALTKSGETHSTEYFKPTVVRDFWLHGPVYNYYSSRDQVEDVRKQIIKTQAFTKGDLTIPFCELKQIQIEKTDTWQVDLCDK